MSQLTPFSDLPTIGDDLVKEVCTEIFTEMAHAGFEWWEYPTLIDAIEDRVRDGLTKAHQDHWTFSHACPVAPRRG